MAKDNALGGRPKHFAEYVEGKEASVNFLHAMSTVIPTEKPNRLV